jgi:hypothetical protein
MRWKRLTLVPERLAQNLGASSLSRVNIFSLANLVDLAIVILGIAPVLIKLCHLHLFLDCGEVD